MTKAKMKSKATTKHPEGYRVFMSGFADYARENGIKIHGGRGSFAKKAGEVWKDLKGKPSWKENLDIVLPQYLEGVEGVTPGLSINARKTKIAQELSSNEFNWWGLKNLYGVWHENIYTYPEKDRLFVTDAENQLIDLTKPDDVYIFGQLLKEEVHYQVIDKYSYFKISVIESNELGGIDVSFTLEETNIYTTHFHDKDSFSWSPAMEVKYGIKKQLIEETSKITGKKIPTFSKALKEKEIKELDIKNIEASERKLAELNKAIDKLESQLNRKLITKAEYKKYLQTLYKK
jgi:hypothetical protein